MELFDTHNHLQEPELAPVLTEAMGRARESGVVRMMSCGTQEDDWQRLSDIATRYDGVLVSYGLHPWYVDRRSPRWLERLETLVAGGRCGVGEIGLDHAVDPRRDEEQMDVFMAQLRLAQAYRRPVSIHCRKAFGALEQALAGIGGISHGGVLHAYSGSADMVPRFERLGLHISFGGSLTRSGNRRGRRSIVAVSPERLLIETDAPAMNPSGSTTEVNEPANLRLVLRTVAQVLGVSASQVAEQTNRNAVTLFGV